MELGSRIAYLVEPRSLGNRMRGLRISVSLTASGRETVRCFGVASQGILRGYVCSDRKKWGIMTVERYCEKNNYLGPLLDCSMSFEAYTG